jgi:DNA-binding transcriptional MerR regulator
MRRYGISEDTLDRWLKRGLLPPPIRIRGKLWRPEDLEAMEEAGQLPCPVSS